jgi:hypothetical protein
MFFGLKLLFGYVIFLVLFLKKKNVFTFFVYYHFIAIKRKWIFYFVFGFV